jgi:hypothetical protein
MPTKQNPHLSGRLALLAALAALAQPALAQAQADDTTPYYFGGSLGLARVTNLYRQSNASNDDTVTSIGLLAGMDERLGRQHLTLDGSLQDNRYSKNDGLNNASYNLRGALNWQTVDNLSGTLSAKSTRALADFNIGGGVDPIFRKNTERNDEYAALARLGVATRFTLEGGWTYRKREFSAIEYDRFDYSQNTGSLGIYGTPGANVKLGLVARHTKGQYPRYPVSTVTDPVTGQPVIDPVTGLPQVISAPNDFTRNDIDFTTYWSTGGSSTLNTRLSRSRLKNSLTGLRDFSGTTGAIGWDWRPTAKLQLGLQYARDTGSETMARAIDLNRVYTSWQVTGNYAMTAKLSANAMASRGRSRLVADASASTSVADTFDNDKTFGLGLRWAISRGFSLACQYTRASRDSSVPQYVYTASSYGCTGQALFF